ncbi:Uncharacterised protein [Bordetella pertussis]|nr:Uncharacterised protein [Bordetella pertussis]CPP48992.1 Uncharacterised protein [Bordetella pertussis]
MVTRPILRPRRASRLPYRCSLALGTASAADQSGSRGACAPGSNHTSPRILSITAGASRSALPSGSPAMTRACCSNWLVTQASMV